MTLVTDNGSNFTSREFSLFLEKNGVRHITSAPYQPSTNGQAENTVRGLKNFLRHCPDGDWKLKLDQYLFQYRVTPHSTTGISPAELMFGRKLRTVYDLAHPRKIVQETVLSRQESQKSNYEGKLTRNLVLTPEEPVMVKNYSTVSKDRWVPAEVVQQTGPVSYKCKLPGGRVVRRHQDQILRRSLPQNGQVPIEPMQQESGDLSSPMPNVPELVDSPKGDIQAESPAKVTTPVRRSTRVVKPPDRLDL